MPLRIHKIIEHIYALRLWFFGTALVAITLPAYLDADHFLLNLEPYPDGLLYSLSARNVAQGGLLGLQYHDFIIQHWVPPLYSIILIPAYFLNPHPASFLFVNVILLLLSCFLFDQILAFVTKSKWLHLLGLVLFQLHGLLIWIALLPMSENAAIPLFLLVVLGLLKPGKHSILFVCLGAVGLFLTRYSIITVPFTAILLLITQHSKKFTTTKWQLYSLLQALLVFAIIALTGIWRQLLSLALYVFSDATSGQAYYGPQYLYNNLIEYGESLLGLNGRFLWKFQSLTSPIISLTALLFLGYSIRRRTLVGVSLFFLFIGVIIPPLFFYTIDDRYILPLVPLLILGFIKGQEIIAERHQFAGYIMALLAFVTLLITQQQIYKELVLANIFHRTSAWQYKAIKHFDSYLNDDDYLITALPPFLTAAYQSQTYKLLPLSYSQEFLQNEQHVWGSMIDYQDLSASYKTLIEENHSVYISNAYITHQLTVTEDYEKYRDQFELSLVSEGCLGACNIYQLKLKNPSNLE